MRQLSRKATELIRAQGDKVIDLELIERTLREIGTEYKPGLIRWIRGQTDQWRLLLKLEASIHQAALDKDEEGLTVALTHYKKFFQDAIPAYQKAGKGENKTA